MRKHVAWILLPAAVLLLLAAMLVTAQLRETVKLFAPLSPEAVQAVMAARQAPEAYELGRGALEAAGYGRAYASLLLEPLWRPLLWAFFILLAAVAAAIGLWQWAARREARQMEAFCRWLKGEGGDMPETSLPRSLREACGVLRQEKLDQAAAHKQTLEELRRYHADVLHQINTPLAVLRLSLDRRGAAEEAAQVEKAAALVRDALALDRIGSGAVRLRFQEVPVAELLELVCNDLEPLAMEKSITVQTEGTDGISWCCDPFWMQEALENLLKNALEHSPAGSTVSLTWSQSARENGLVLRDQGPGFSREMASRLFTRYALVRRQAGESHGLGLSIARELLRLHFGSISVKNHPGGGAEFHIAFPRLEPDTVYGEKSP